MAGAEKAVDDVDAGTRTMPREHLSPDGIALHQHPFVVACAPAGYGKTVLIAQWRQWATDRSLRCISIRGAAQIAEIEREVATGAPLLLLVDDLQWADAPVRAFIRRLFDARSPSVTMLIAGRSVQGIGLARACLTGTVRKLGPAELRFSKEETVRWLAGQGIASDPAVRAHLDRLAAGWPAAIVFAVPEVRDRSITLANLSAKLCRPGGAFSDYLEEEILAPLAPELRELLLNTAPLRLFDLSLGAAISGDLRRLLPRMIEQGLLSEQERGGRVIYSHHPLLAEFLEDALARDDPNCLIEIHRRAMNLHAAGGRWMEALPHAFATGELDRALDFLAQASARHQRVGRWRDFAGWTKRLDPEVIARYPQIAVEAACTHAVLFEAAEARAYMEDLERRHADLDPAVRNDLLVARALVATFADRPREALTAGLKGAEEFDGNDGYSIGTLRLAAAFGLIAEGDVEKARGFLQQARVAHEQGGSAFGLSVALALTGLTYAMEGDGETALVIWEQGSNVTQQMPTGSAVSAIAAGYAAELRYERNEIQEAEVLIEHCFDSSIEVVLPDTVRALYLTTARIAFLQGRLHDAKHVLEEAIATGLRREWPQLVNAIAWEKVNFALRRGRLAEARELGEAIPACEETRMGRWEADLLGRLRLKAMLEPCRDTIREVHAAVVRAMGRSRAAFGARLRVVEALARENAGDRLGALRTLKQAVGMTQAGDMVRTVLDGGPTIDMLLSHLRGEMERDGFPLSRLFPETVRQPAGKSADQMGAIEPLSGRELDIVAGIGEGLTNAEIGRRLLLTENTVKWHLQHVFAKLDVSNRTRALFVARQHGLIG